MRKTVIILLMLSVSLCGYCEIEDSILTIVSYNVENLFHPDTDSINTDTEFTPEGNRHWTTHRYFQKIHNIAKVLTLAQKEKGADIIGLCEVENAQCLRNLCYELNNRDYRYLHYDSPDKRGIDVALVYNRKSFQLIDSGIWRIDEFDTRDMLYACGITRTKDTLHLVVCHLPSQLGGSANTSYKRSIVKSKLQQKIDSIQSIDEEANIIVLGDMNMDPEDDLAGMRNLMMEYTRSGKGTHKHEGKWHCIDQFYCSNNLVTKVSTRIFDDEWTLEEDKKYLGYKPKRSFVGYKYQNGYSDHLAIVLEMILKSE